MKYPLTPMTNISYMGNSYSKISCCIKIREYVDYEKVKYHSQNKLKDLTYK